MYKFSENMCITEIFLNNLRLNIFRITFVFILGFSLFSLVKRNLVTKKL